MKARETLELVKALRKGGDAKAAALGLLRARISPAALVDTVAKFRGRWDRVAKTNRGPKRFFRGLWYAAIRPTLGL